MNEFLFRLVENRKPGQAISDMTKDAPAKGASELSDITADDMKCCAMHWADVFLGVSI